jgi:TPR repeat protein
MRISLSFHMPGNRKAAAHFRRGVLHGAITAALVMTAVSNVQATQKSVPSWKTELRADPAEADLSAGRDFIKKKDYKKAKLYFERAASQGSVPAMLALADQYKKGLGVPRDDAKAFEWFMAAAVKEDPVGMLEIGDYYEWGKGGIKVDYERAHEYFEKAAAKGNSTAMYRLGVHYREGRAVAKDAHAALKWLSAAAELNPGVCKIIAEFYVLGNGVQINFAEARRWYEKGAAANDVNAKELLRRLPAEEAFHLRDYEKAARLQRAVVRDAEKEETKSEGRPGSLTAVELADLAYYELFARHFEAALKASERATSLEPDQPRMPIYGAHAAMFLGYAEGTRAAHRDGPKKYPAPYFNPEYWKKKVLEDFAEFEKAGLTHPQMAEIREMLTKPAQQD